MKKVDLWLSMRTKRSSILQVGTALRSVENKCTQTQKKLHKSRGFYKLKQTRNATKSFGRKARVRLILGIMSPSITRRVLSITMPKRVASELTTINSPSKLSFNSTHFVAPLVILSFEKCFTNLDCFILPSEWKLPHFVTFISQLDLPLGIPFHLTPEKCTISEI